MGPTIAGEIGVYGYRPSVLMDMLAGKRAEVSTKIGAYMRTFAGDCSPSDLETALQVCFMILTHSLRNYFKGYLIHCKMFSDQCMVLYN